MKKIVNVVILVVVISSMFFGIVAAVDEPFGPAPNSGDGIPDSSGFRIEDDYPWANDETPGEAIGPAPNSGDGIPDGSGFP